MFLRSLQKGASYGVTFRTPGKIGRQQGKPRLCEMISIKNDPQLGKTLHSFRLAEAPGNLIKKGRVVHARASRRTMLDRAAGGQRKWEAWTRAPVWGGSGREREREKGRGDKVKEDALDE
jgi:hypothetical protein